MNNLDNIEIIKQHSDLVSQQRVIDTLRVDMVTLESIQRNLETTLGHDGLDIAAREMVEVTINNTIAKYGIENISLESTDSPVVDAQLSMEKIGEKLKQFGGAVKRGIAKIWQTIVKFFKWIGSLFSRKKATIIKENEQINKFETVIIEAARKVDNYNDDPKFKQVMDDLNVLLDGLPKLNDMVSVGNGPDATQAPSGEQNTARQTSMPKTVLSNIAKEIAVEKSIRTAELEYGSMFSYDGKVNDSSDRVLMRGSISSYQTTYLMDEVSDILPSLFAALEKYHNAPDSRAFNDQGQLDADVKNIANEIYTLATSEKLNPAENSTMPGLSLTHDLKKPDEYQVTSMREFLSPSSFKFEFNPPERKTLKVPLLSTKQITKYNKTCLEVLNLKRDGSKTYNKYLKLDVSKYMVDGMSPEVNWCLNWIVKLTSTIMVSERYTKHCDKHMSYLKRDSLKALGK